MYLKLNEKIKTNWDGKLKNITDKVKKLYMMNFRIE